MTRTYSEVRCYSPILDCEISRISMADDRGGEFFVEIEGQGKKYRQAKDEALTDLAEAIEMGLFPGRVTRS